MKMYPNDWRARLTAGVVVGACMAAVMMLGPLVGIHGFWPIVVAIIVGILLGNLVGRLLFGPSSGGPPDQSAERHTRDRESAKTMNAESARRDR